MRNALIAAALLLSGSAALAVPENFLTDPDEAMALAKEQDKLILLFFNRYG